MDDQLTISHPGPQYIADLEQLWITTFGDPPELIEAFFDAFPPALHGWILTRGEQILSSAYLLHGNLYLSGDALQPAAYVYAVATPEQFRGKGYGGLLMRHFSEMASQRDLLLYTRPANKGLFQWYADVMQAIPAAGMRSINVPADTSSPSLSVSQVTPDQYGEIRERHLRATPHIALSHAFLQTQAVFSAAEGGGLFAVGDGCYTCEMQDEMLIIKELLISPKMKDAAIQTLLHRFSSPQARLFVPSESSDAFVAYRSDRDLSHLNWGLLLD